MGDRKFVLNVDGKKHPSPTTGTFLEILEGVARESREFVILSEEGCGWFVQAAGAYGSLVVEYQRRAESGQRQHLRLCRSGLGDSGEVRRPPRVPGYQGYREKEIVSVADAIAIFESFLVTLDTPTRFEGLDISAELGLE